MGAKKNQIMNLLEMRFDYQSARNILINWRKLSGIKGEAEALDDAQLKSLFLYLKEEAPEATRVHEAIERLILTKDGDQSKKEEPQKEEPQKEEPQKEEPQKEEPQKEEGQLKELPKEEPKEKRKELPKEETSKDESKKGDKEGSDGDAGPGRSRRKRKKS